MKELLVHLRKYDNDRNLQAKGGATVYFAPTDKGTYRLWIALCSDQDVFCRKIGHAIVKGREQVYGDGAVELSSLEEVKDALFNAVKKVGDKRPYDFWEKLVSKMSTS